MRRRCLCTFCLEGTSRPEYWRDRQSNPYLKREWPGYVIGPEMPRYGILEVAPGASGDALVEPPVFLQHEEIVEAIQRRWNVVPQALAKPVARDGSNAEQAAD